MRIGIRAKLVVLLVAVALLPLLAALLTIVVGGRQLRGEIFGQSVLSQVTAESKVMQVELQKDIELLNVALQERLVLFQLRDVKEKLSDIELANLDRRWKSLPETSGPLRRVLKNATADILTTILKENEHLAELIVTDRFGQTIAATGRTTDYYQADEEWWQQCYNKGRGKIYVPYISYDESADVWGVDICLPIKKNGIVWGVAKATIDMRYWMPECQRKIGGSTGNLVLVGHDGFILHSREILDRRDTPKVRLIDDWELIVNTDLDGQWRNLPDGSIQAYAPVQLPPNIDDLEVDMKCLTLVLNMPESYTRAGLAQLGIMMILIGLVSIVALFLCGVILIDRILINRIKRISKSARQVAEGELRHRADGSWAGTRIFGTDEITDLARDFNNMVRRLDRSHRELMEANELKENFIRIAGHELRTPISYIVGMASLMKTSRDPDRLAKAIDTMGFKAGRLDEIIQAMFKLIPDQSLEERLKYEPVSLSKMMESVYLDCKPWIERRKQRLVVETGADDTIVHADEAKLRDIIENLVMNAIKFTPNEGLVKINVQRQLGGYVAIEVIDQGPGIPESDQPHIFEPFYSGSDVLKHSTGKSGYGKKGMGLGLAIVKHFVDIHSGSISFNCTATGTHFTVQLPIDPPSRGGHH